MTVGIVSANKSFWYSTFAYALSVETEVLAQNLLRYFNENIWQVIFILSFASSSHI